MRRMKRWLGTMLSVMIAVGSLQIPAFATEEGTTAEVAAEAEEAVLEQEEIELESEQTAEETEQNDDSEKITGEAVPEEITEEPDTETVSVEALDSGSTDIVDSGTCGPNLTWTLTGEEENLTLTISGNGMMDNYGFDDNAPWASKREGITAVYIQEGATSIGRRAFEYCAALSYVEIPKTVISIENSAFQECNALTDIEIPEGVESIGNSVFWHCINFKSITIPKSIKHIENAFGDYDRFTTYYNGDVEDWLNLDADESLMVGNLYFGGEPAAKIVVPEGLTQIRAGAFNWCANLESVQLPESLTSIGDDAFYYCESLKSINIPNSVQYIGAAAFCGCRSLQQDLVIPEGVTSIEYCAFSRCGLTGIRIPGSASVIEEEAFYNSPSLKTVVMEEGVTRIEKMAFSFCQGLRDLTIPTTVKYIEKDAFDNMYVPMRGVCKVHISDLAAWIGIEYGGEYGLSGSCINGDLYLGDEPLTDVVVPDEITEIPQGPFNCMMNIERVTIPDSVKSIKGDAFVGCDSLKRILLPASITKFENRTFNLDQVLIRYRGTKEQWDQITGSKKVRYRSIVYDCFSADADFELSGTVFVYTGKEIKPAVTVTLKGRKLKEGVDYELVYQNNISVGHPSVDINGIGKYCGTDTFSYTILPASTAKVACKNVASGIKVTWEKVEGATKYYIYRKDASSSNRYYDELGWTSMLRMTDQQVQYNSGKKYIYKVVANTRGVGTSPKSRTATMYRLMPIGIKSLSNPAAGKMTVTYDKANGSSGYVVRYGLKNDMSDAKVITVSGSNTTSRTFSNMKKGKTYYVQVRTYKIENSVRYYSGYCTTKTITIKK